MAIKLQFMIIDFKPLPPSNARLQDFDSLTLEFNDFAAHQADKVVMVLPCGPPFKAEHPVTELARRRPTAFSQQPQSTVYRGIPNPQISLPKSMVQFGRAQVGTGFNEHPHNLITLAGGIEAPFFQ